MSLRTPFDQPSALVRRLWPFVFICGLGFPLIGSVYYKAAASPRADKPRVVIEENRYNFGEVFKGEALHHTFRVRNTGTATLQLSEAAISPPKKKPGTGPSVGMVMVSPSIPGLRVPPAMGLISSSTSPAAEPGQPVELGLAPS